MSEQDRQAARGGTSSRGANPAQVKGDIDAGRTGDKVAGPDVAAAPLGTDTEAGGVQMSPEHVAEVREQEKAGRPREGTANAATPELQPNARMGPQRNLPLAVIIGVVVAVLLAILLYSVL